MSRKELASFGQELIPSKLTVELEEVLGLLEEFQLLPNNQNLNVIQNLPPNLLEQCILLCDEAEGRQEEPIRTVHHFACTGGTLISKCIASMPNTQLLSEVDPLSCLGETDTNPQFAPSDIAKLMRQSTHGASPELISELFLNNLKIIHSKSANSGLRLILRDHAHSHYCVGDSVPSRATLRNLVASKFAALSVLTVRDPIDSYLSLQNNGWIHFTPSSFDEYCRRYLTFINDYDGVEIIRYEDFVVHPEKVMQDICRILKLPFNPSFQDVFSVHKITGDSGRSGGIIEARDRRPLDKNTLEEFETSAMYKKLCSVLGY